MQRKTAEQLIEATRPLVGRTLTLELLDRDTGSLAPRDLRIVANDRVVNLKDPAEARVCLDVYAEAEDLETGERMHLCLEKLRKQRPDVTDG